MRLSVSALDPRRLRRREVPLTGAQRLSAAMMTAPVAEGLRSASGTIREAADTAARGRAAAEDERSVTDAIAGVPAGDWPYTEIPADRMTGYRLAAMSEFLVPKPEYHPAPGRAPRTAPMAKLPANARTAPARAASTGREAIERTVHGLRGVDFAAVDEAKKTEGATHAGMRRARGPAPLGDALAQERRSALVAVAADGDWKRVAWRPPAVPVRRHADALLHQLGDLKWPDISGFDPGADDLYAELLRRVSLITGTTGIGSWRAVPAGGGVL